jgi:nucleotide-binding universal stress UspA family protein
MKHILLPTDFSDNAFNAIKYAVQLFKDEACKFYLLHTYTPVIVSSASMIDSYSALALQKVVQDNAQKNLDELQKKISNKYPNKNHNFTTIASFNLLIVEMRNIVEENHIEMVIMGTQGATGAKEIFLGTHTMYAIKKMKCPVLAVPANFEYEAPKEILFPTDYKLDKDNKYLSALRELCGNHISRLNILNAYYGTPLSASQLDTKSFLDNFFKDNSHLFHIAEGTDVLGAVEQFQMKARINLIVMIHNQHNFLENILFKPVINQVVYHTNVPFLVIPSVARQ